MTGIGGSDTAEQRVVTHGRRDRRAARVLSSLERGGRRRNQLERRLRLTGQQFRIDHGQLGHGVEFDGVWPGVL